MRTRPVLSALVMTLLFLSAEAGGNAPHRLSSGVGFDVGQLSMELEGEYSHVGLQGCDLTQEIGSPQLPVKTLHYLIPEGAMVTGITVTSPDPVELRGSFRVYPVQHPRILPMPGVEEKGFLFTPPDPAVYSSDQPYPTDLVRCVSVGNMGRHRIASLLVYPLQYVPSQGKLLSYPQIDFEIELEMTKSTGLRGGTEDLTDAVRRLVVNPYDISEEGGRQGVEYFPYVIITPYAYKDSFGPLAEWKTKKGLPSRIVTTDSIYGEFTGFDGAEKIRNFIKFAHEEWNTQWVLLGGDTEVFPDRVAYAMTCEAGFYPDEDSIRADLYYSDLDGTWDLNGNHVYGEVADSVDLYPDVFVGRAPVNTLFEAGHFVEKIITYEREPPTDYQLSMLFPAEILWQNPYTDASIGKDRIDLEYVPPRYDPITKLYESLGNENYSTVTTALNEGQSITNHDGHANYYIMGAGDDYLFNSDMDDLTNGERQGILYSIGCWSTAIDYDCIAEHWVNNPGGGGVAFIGNSRYGWGSPGNPGFGYSDRFDATFYEVLFGDDVYSIGELLAVVKAHYVPRSLQENVYRIHQYQLTLLGDPEMPLWTDTPGILTVSHPDSVPTGQSPFNVTVSADGLPVAQARVCLRKGDEFYTSQTTDADGQVVLAIDPSTPGEIEITVSAHDFLPYENSTLVYSHDLPYLVSAGYELSGGNGDDELNPGETVSLTVAIENAGAVLAPDVVGTLRTNDAHVTIVDSVEDYGTVGPGETTTCTGSYEFSISPSLLDGHRIVFDLDLQDSGGRDWMDAIVIPVSTPVVHFLRDTVIDSSGGDGDGVPEPGERFDLVVWMRNSGLGLGRDVTATLASDDPEITLVDSTCDMGDLVANGFAEGAFELELDVLSVTGDCKNLRVKTETSDGYTSEDTLLLTVGDVVFADDMESGQNGWTHGGAADLWHLTDHRSHAGDYSWYCGNDGVWQYENDMSCYLESPEIILASGAMLTFWHWYDVTIYGVDGLHVQILHGTQTDTLDYIGSGGALDGLLMGNDWIEENYDLSGYPVGDTIRVRLSWTSDGSDVEEGFYVDDLRVGPTETARPEVPLLTSPADSSSLNDQTPTFAWSETAGSGGAYEMEYATDPAFTQDLTRVEGLTDATYTPVLPLDESLWFWRVQAVSGMGLESGYGDPSVFRVDTTSPPVPTLLAPPDSHETSDNTPSFVWTGVPDFSVSYTLQYDSDTSFTWPGLVQIDEIPDTAYTIPDSMSLSDATYYWRLRAVDGAGNPSAFQATPFCLVVSQPSFFIRGDALADEDIAMSDAIYVLRYLYVPGTPDPPCLDAADSDDDGHVVMDDAVYLLRWLYVPSSPSPLPPFPGCGSDPTSDGLDCMSHPCGKYTRKPMPAKHAEEGEMGYRR